MNYSKIKVLQMQKKLSDAAFAKSIGMSNPGYRSMLIKQTCTVQTIEQICKVYGLSITYFFDEPSISVEGDQNTLPKSECIECIKKEAHIDFLKDQLKEKEEKIDALNREIGRGIPRKKTG